MLKRFIILSIAIISCVAFEQQTKVWAQEWLQQGVSVKCLSGIFQFILAENQGAFLGLGAQIPEFMRIVIFTDHPGLLIGWVYLGSTGKGFNSHGFSGCRPADCRRYKQCD